MSRPSTQLRFEDVYESFRVASPASPLVQQESGEGHPTIDICGRRCLESFEKLAPPTSWRRTFAASLVGMKGWFSTRCALTWKVKATKSSRSYFLLQASTRRTAETESSLLLGTPTAGLNQGTGRSKNFRGNRTPTPLEYAQGLLLTPTTREEPVDLDKFKARMEKYPNGTTMPNLATQVQQMLPTPTARCQNDGTPMERPEGQPSRRSELNHLIAQEMHNGMLPTPSAGDGHKTTSNTHQKTINRLAPVGTGFHLSPQFVAEMMGFPLDWTVSPFQGGDENQ